MDSSSPHEQSYENIHALEPNSHQSVARPKLYDFTQYVSRDVFQVCC
jgi:hypothetical protein